LEVSIGYDNNIYNLTSHECYGNISAKYIVKKIEPVNISTYDDYVYDLETEDGTFHAGIGEIILKNTDSIFIDFGLKDADGKPQSDKAALQETINLSMKAAEKINSIVPPPQRIVYEKTMHPFILITKKKYVGLLYNHDINKCYLMSMGIVLKRRDNAPIVKIIVGGIIDQIVKTKDITCALKYAKTVLRKLMDGKYPIDKFILSKALKARYKRPNSIAHRVLADRMGIRDPGNKPQVNDRIQYVYVVKDIGRQKKKDIKQGELIENPEYVVKNGLKIDYLYYLEHQIINPASQILELMMTPKKVEKFFNVYIIEEQNKRKNRQSMEKWLDISQSFNDSGNHESYF
jgi:DNA polymerase elongation subunit (family B)